VITPINIALLGVVLAAVALVILRRRRSGATHEAVSEEMPDETMTTVDEPAAPIHDDVFSKHVWSEAAATLTPVREDEPVAAADDPDEDQPDEAEDELAFPPEDDAPGAAQEPDDAREDDAGDLDAPEGEHDQDTGEIAGLELEDLADPDDGLGDIITEPGWYLPGETDMTRGSPGAPSGSLIPQGEFAMAGGLRDEGADLAAEAPSALLAQDDVDFSATAPWAAPAESGTEPAESNWLGLADEEAAAAVEPEVSFDIATSPSDDLFELPPLDEGIPGNGLEPGAPPPALDRWQDPVTPVAPLGIASAAAGMTVAQHGPLTVSIDPAALVAMEVEEIKRSTSQGDGAVSWELTLKVELRRDNGSGTAD
jgi:hypothetical protein